MDQGFSGCRSSAVPCCAPLIELGSNFSRPAQSRNGRRSAGCPARSRRPTQLCLFLGPWHPSVTGVSTRLSLEMPLTPGCLPVLSVFLNGLAFSAFAQPSPVTCLGLQQSGRVIAMLADTWSAMRTSSSRDSALLDVEDRVGLNSMPPFWWTQRSARKGPLSLCASAPAEGPPAAWLPLLRTPSRCQSRSSPQRLFQGRGGKGASGGAAASAGSVQPGSWARAAGGWFQQIPAAAAPLALFPAPAMLLRVPPRWFRSIYLLISEVMRRPISSLCLIHFRWAAACSVAADGLHLTGLLHMPLTSCEVMLWTAGLCHVCGNIGRSSRARFPVFYSHHQLLPVHGAALRRTAGLMPVGFP